MFSSSLLFALLLFQADAPASLEALVREAQADLKAERYLEARQKLTRAVERNVRDPALWSYLGIAHERLNEFDQAIEAFRKAALLAPSDAQTYLNLGLLYWRKGDVNESLDYYRKGLQLSPNDAKGNENYALLLMRIGRYQEAIDPLLRVKKEKPADLSIRVALIESFFRGGMLLEGETETQEVLNSRIASPAEQVKLAVALIEDSQPEMAEQALKKALSAEPNLGDGHGVLGLLYEKRGKYDQAAQELQRAVQLSPESLKYALALGQTLLMGRQYSEALAFLQSSQQRFGSSLEFRFKLALSLYFSREYEKAALQLETLLTPPTPRLALVQFYLGNSYSALGQLKKAELCYQQGIGNNPKKTANYIALAALLRKPDVNRIEEAISNLQKVLQLNSTDRRAQLQLALCYESKEDALHALPVLEDVSRAHPDSITVHKALARVYDRLGKKSESAQESATVDQLQARTNRTRAEFSDPLSQEFQDLAELANSK